jgi:hypothetical protein
MTTSSFATTPTVAVQRPESAPPAPPHVEEITFTAAPAPGAVEGNSEGLVSSGGANSLLDRDGAAAGTTDGDDHPRSAAATAKRWIDVSPDSESGTRNPREHSAEEQSPAGEPRVVQPDERSGAERQPAPQESIEMVESQFAAQGPRAQGRRAPRPEAKDSDQSQPTRVREPADAVRDEHLEREMIVHSYLKEVRAWVAAPPELDQRELERQRDAERPPAGHRDVFALEPEVEPTAAPRPGRPEALERQRVAERPPAGHSDVFALEPETEPTAPRSGRPEALEVQDLNLSIGTISIVIEEPKQTAPAALPTSPRADRSPERPASEPTRLSRYYLTRW